MIDVYSDEPLSRNEYLLFELIKKLDMLTAKKRGDSQ